MNLSFFNVSTLAYWLPGLLLLILPARLPAADIYKWTDDSGAVHYSDKPQVPSATPVDIQAAPDAEKIKQAREREALLRRSADDLQLNRLQREAQQRESERERRKQIKEQAGTEQKTTDTESREGNSEGHYQKQWQQQMPPQHPILHPSHP